MNVWTRMHQLRTPWMAWWLALALVVAPALGRMHEVLHAHELPQAQATMAESSSSLDAHALFGEHSPLECLALDQFCHAIDGCSSVDLQWHALPSSTPIWSADPAALPAATAVFLARAPPIVVA